MLERERLFTHFVCFRPMLGTVGRGSMSRISRTSIVSWKIPNTIKYLTHIANIQRCIKVYIRWLLETYSGKSSIRLVTCASQNQRSTVLLSIYSHPTLSDNIFRTYAKLLFVWQTKTHTDIKNKKKNQQGHLSKPHPTLLHHFSDIQWREIVNRPWYCLYHFTASFQEFVYRNLFSEEKRLSERIYKNNNINRVL